MDDSDGRDDRSPERSVAELAVRSLPARHVRRTRGIPLSVTGLVALVVIAGTVIALAVFGVSDPRGPAPGDADLAEVRNAEPPTSLDVLPPSPLRAAGPVRVSESPAPEERPSSGPSTPTSEQPTQEATPKPRPTSTPTPAPTRPREALSGFVIKPTGRADGGFVGSRNVGPSVGYRISSRSGDEHGSFGPVVRREGDASVARASWILSAYGLAASATRAAAVDLATYALLDGQSLSGPRASARLAQLDRAGEIRSLASTLLEQSAAAAGPYRLDLGLTPVTIGDDLRVELLLRSARGSAVPRRPLTVVIDGTAYAVRTDAGGRAVVTADASRAGYVPVRARVAGLPEWHLFVRRPTSGGASPLALAGRTTSMSESGAVAVRARPRVLLRPSVTGPRGTRLDFEVVDVPEAYAARAAVTLYGPFTDKSRVRCGGGKIAATRTVDITGAGDRAVPRVRVDKAGYYSWRVRLPGVALGVPVDKGCGLVVARVKVG